MPAIVIVLAILLWFFIALKAMGSGLDTYLGEIDPARISPVISRIIDGVAYPTHGIIDNGPCGETRPCVGTGPTPLAPVPLPGAIWMMLAALGGLAMIGRRR